MVTTANIDYGMDPQGRFRFYGIYAGKVRDNKDPLKKSRLKISVDQPTGGEITAWAEACLPVTSNSNHPDHQEHTAAQIATLLTTQSTSVSGADPQGGSVGITIPALTVVAKSGAGTLKHPHKTSVDKTNKWNGSSGTVFNDATSTNEHTPHRLVPDIGQQVWVMFIAGDPGHPVWIGVRL
jgi:hypothetical protein